MLEPKAVALRQSAAEHRAELEGLRHAEDGGAAAAAAAAAEVSRTALAVSLTINVWTDVLSARLLLLLRLTTTAQRRRVGQRLLWEVWSVATSGTGWRRRAPRCDGPTPPSSHGTLPHPLCWQSHDIDGNRVIEDCLGLWTCLLGFGDAAALPSLTI